MAAGLTGEQPAQHPQAGNGQDVDHNQEDGHKLVLAERDQPGERRIANPRVPEGRIHGDAERGVVEVDWIEGQAVVELAVVAKGRLEDQARRQGGMRETAAGQNERTDIAVGEEQVARYGEAGRPQEGDQARKSGPVRP